MNPSTFAAASLLTWRKGWRGRRPHPAERSGNRSLKGGREGRAGVCGRSAGDRGPERLSTFPRRPCLLRPTPATSQRFLLFSCGSPSCWSLELPRDLPSHPSAALSPPLGLMGLRLGPASLPCCTSRPAQPSSHPARQILHPPDLSPCLAPCHPTRLPNLPHPPSPQPRATRAASPQHPQPGGLLGPYLVLWSPAQYWGASWGTLASPQWGWACRGASCKFWRVNKELGA